MGPLPYGRGSVLGRHARPCFRATLGVVFISEGQPQTELDVARAERGGRPSKLRAGEVAHRWHKVDAVEQVEELGAEVNLTCLAEYPEREALDDIQVRVGVAGPEIHVSPKKARPAGRRLPEITGLEDAGQELGPLDAAEIPSEARSVREVVVEAVGIVVASIVADDVSSRVANRRERLGYS